LVTFPVQTINTSGHETLVRPQVNFIGRAAEKIFTHEGSWIIGGENAKMEGPGVFIFHIRVDFFIIRTNLNSKPPKRNYRISRRKKLIWACCPEAAYIEFLAVDHISLRSSHQ